MPSDKLDRLLIKGFKSIASCEIGIKQINILIGANGAGKSNFLNFFEFAKHIINSNLQVEVGRQGGPDAVLHFGRKKTTSLKAEFQFGKNTYEISLDPTHDNRMMFTVESLNGITGNSSGHFESENENWKGQEAYNQTINTMKKLQVYRFYDVGNSSYVKQKQPINDNFYLRHDASNLAAYLYWIKQNHPASLEQIEIMVRLVAPFFKKFVLRPTIDNNESIELEWFQEGGDTPFKAHHFSDGTLRFICLATIFLQPHENQPTIIMVDEPELGLHPYAINVLAGLIKSASVDRQVIISTQSADLLSEFETKDVIVCDYTNNESVLSRLDEDKYNEWLNEYSLGELWKKSIINGRP